jgi:hypothetical protein
MAESISSIKRAICLSRCSLSRIHAVENHEWTLMNTNLRTRTIIQPVAPQSLNDGHEFRRKGTPILSQQRGAHGT